MNRSLKIIAFLAFSQGFLVSAGEPEDLVFRDGFELCEVDSVKWDGGGDGSSWFDELNWAANTLPADGDTVSIRAPGDLTVIYNSSPGALRITCLDSTESLTVTGGTLEIDGNGWVNQNLTISNGTLSTSGNLRVLETFMHSNGTLNGAGTVTVSGVFDWAGGRQGGSGETIADGEAVLSGTTFRFLDERTLTLNAASDWAGGDLRLLSTAVINNNTSLDVLSDADMVDWDGGGFATFNNNAPMSKLTGSGLTNIIAIFNNSGAISVASGQLGFNREFVQDASGSLGVDIASGEFDSYAVGQSATLDGALTINLLGGFMPAVDATFVIMTYSSLTGTFDLVNGVDIGNGTHFSIIYGATDITLKVVPD